MRTRKVTVYFYCNHIISFLDSTMGHCSKCSRFILTAASFCHSCGAAVVQDRDVPGKKLSIVNCWQTMLPKQGFVVHLSMFKTLFSWEPNLCCKDAVVDSLLWV